MGLRSMSTIARDLHHIPGDYRYYTHEANTGIGQGVHREPLPESKKQHPKKPNDNRKDR